MRRENVGIMEKNEKKLREYKGVGEKTEKLLQKLGLFTDQDLIHYYPRAYEYYAAPPASDPVPSEQVVSIKAVVCAPVRAVPSRRGTNIVTTIQSGARKLQVIWFHSDYLRGILRRGYWYVFRGKITEKGSSLSMEHPQLYRVEDYHRLEGKLLPVYGLTKGLAGSTLIRLMRQVLAEWTFQEELPQRLVQDYGLLSREEAVRNIHFPSGREVLEKARRRLVFEEFFRFILSVRQLRLRKNERPCDWPMKPVWRTRDLIDSLPYRLTGAQRRTFSEIEKDLSGYYRMSRLIQGDVGSGKTILAFLAVIQAVENGCQAALMAPTEVLAKQHFISFGRLMEGLGEEVCPYALLTGSVKAAERRKIYRGISDGSIRFVIGTHALIQEKVSFANLGLAIIDEQHRFGVRQRELLSEADKPAHLLVMSATPIPRTLAAILYGDLDISVLDEMPEGRLPIKNALITPEARETAWRFIGRQLSEGRQAYVICPMIEESEGLEGENVYDTVLNLKQALGPDVRIGCLHGRMKAEEKTRVMEEFSEGKIGVLVSTTVVEVGVDVPNATVMMIENAERFGLAQLHQLRGRVGRGEMQSYCIFVQHGTDEETGSRLKIMTGSNDGFFVAAEDLRLRGPGDLFGTRQSGDPFFRIGDIYHDADILQQANEASFVYIDEFHG